VDEEQSASQNESGTGGMENCVAECAPELPFGARWLIVKSLGLVGWHGDHLKAWSNSFPTNEAGSRVGMLRRMFPEGRSAIPHIYVAAVQRLF
jgi:hypothetical protein